jgi:hypothetical protein
MPIIHTVVQKIESQRKVPVISYKANVTLLQKPDKDNTRKKHERKIFFHEYKYKTFSKTLVN